jgi:hypothetical protein
MKCPKCNTDQYMQVNPHMLVINKGPEGPLHEVRCERCSWAMTTKDLPEGR